LLFPFFFPRETAMSYEPKFLLRGVALTVGLALLPACATNLP